MNNQSKLANLKTKDKIEHFLLLTNFAVKTTKAGREFLDLELRDESVSLNAKMWNNFQSFINDAKSGSVVKVLGMMDEFNNVPQIKIEKIRSTNEKDEITPEDFLPKSERPLAEMKDELELYINSIQSKNLKQLIQNIFTESNFNKYIKVPAGKAWHHAYIGGLLEHTLEIIKICDLMCRIHPDVNRDLLLTGAILHDFGKIEELDFSGGFDYTDKGKLLGHIVIIANIIEREANKIKGLTEEIKNQLIHLVLSHQGRLEYASPVTPKTVEAIILYHADELSAKTNAYKSAIAAEKDTGNIWTRYLPLAETSLFITGNAEKKDDFKETLF